MTLPPFTQGPIPANPFNCAVTDGLPFGGAEVLVLALIFVFFTAMYCVTFIDVGLKQMWPEKFLDKAVAARVAAIQKGYPLLGKLVPHADKEDEEKKGVVADEETQKATAKALDAATPFYDSCTSQAPYAAGRSVDEDLIPILANNYAFPTVSSYCSSTVRGYAMLSTLLFVAGITLGFLWCHNVIVYPAANDKLGLITLVGYIMIFLTGIVMCGPNLGEVFRNANIVMFSNLPLQVDKKSDKWLRLHELGVGSFIVIPLLTHGYQVYMHKDNHAGLPNYNGMAAGVVVQIVSVVIFGLGMLLGKKKIITVVMMNKWMILAEILGVFSSFMAYVQCEFYATAICSGYYPYFNLALYAAVLFPMVKLVAQHYFFAPTTFPTEASILLLNKFQPVAHGGGPCAMQFSQIPGGENLPVAQPLPTEE